MQSLTLHYDNSIGFQAPLLCVWYPGGGGFEAEPVSSDQFGPVFKVDVERPSFSFKFRDRHGAWEPTGLDREFIPYGRISGPGILDEVWCKADKPFIYPITPRHVEGESAADLLGRLRFNDASYIPGTGGFSGLGATQLEDGRILFGLYHPNAARVFVRGNFNNWQRPGADKEEKSKFIELNLYRGYFGVPNTWLAITDKAKPGDEYEFCVFGGVPPDDRNRLMRDCKDPYARQLGADFARNNSVIVNPSYQWADSNWKTPEMSDLIIYELSVFGFTEGDYDIPQEIRGKFRGVTERIRRGYFNDLGVTALSIMPLGEVPSMQGPKSMGYDPSLHFTVERDFGGPNDLRELVNEAHNHGLAVIFDMVFNHTSNDFNPLWQMIPEHPREITRNEGGLYFNGQSDWGNRLDTWKSDVQNMLIDCCKAYIKEYHADGFRFDATQHDRWMSAEFLHRNAWELRGYKPDILLIAENLPNQSDLNLNGYDGYAQWSDFFHDKVKSLLREGVYDNQDLNNTANLGDIFYFCKPQFASHTNNVVNYVESHDETSPAFEVGTNPSLGNGAAKDRKSRLGLFATMTALGQPMLYMGGEFNPERDRMVVRFDWPRDLNSHGFFQWAKRVIRLRRRYPGLKIHGFNPAEEGKFSWILGPWMGGERGGGQKVVGWRAQPNGAPNDALAVLLNFENHDVSVDLDLGMPGSWVKLADIENVNDIAPEGTNSTGDPATIRSADGRFAGFNLPSSSAFIYKWESPAV
ncbi:MAG: 1,4-alpha-glucan branching protein [Deltaproteobacteria bacterium]|nr:1,4-alpha-glucan branching protein [Deltaproteobacteria bacterium]